MSKTDDTLEIDQTVVDAVAKKAAEAIKVPAVDTDAIAEKVAGIMAEKAEATVKKNVADAGEKEIRREKSLADLPAENRFQRAIRAMRSGDRAELAKYNEQSIKSWTEKSNYQNVTTAADGGAIVPDPEFIAEVDRLTSEYGVASQKATIRSTDRDSVTLLKGTNEVSFTKVGEATAANAQKLTYSASTAVLDKYIAKLIMTNEWIEDAAINVFQDAASEVGRARAKLIDQLVFTDATDGLLSATSGDEYKTVTVGAALTNFDYDDAMDAIYAVNTPARRNGAFYMHPTVWNELRQIKTGDGSNSAANYYAGSPLLDVNPSIAGYPVFLVDVMPDAGDITANEAFAVFGDLSRVLVHVKRQLRLDMFNSGVLTDAGGTDFNLIDQDAEALRATIRLKPQTRFEGAFTIIGTGTVS